MPAQEPSHEPGAVRLAPDTVTLARVSGSSVVDLCWLAAEKIVEHQRGRRDVPATAATRTTVVWASLPRRGGVGASESRRG